MYGFFPDASTRPRPRPPPLPSPQSLEPFYPERMASRILGMGDVLTLYEKAEAAFKVGAKSLNISDPHLSEPLHVCMEHARLCPRSAG